MAVLLLLLAIAGAVLVGDLVWENPAAASLTVWGRSVTGYRQGQLVAVVATLGFVVGMLAVGSVSLRRARRVRRRALRRVERELTAEVAELERENRGLREELARRARALPGPGAGARAADRVSGSTGSGGGRRARAAAAPADRHPEPVYEEARRVARLRGQDLDR